MTSSFSKLNLLTPFTNQVFQRFYDEMLSSPEFYSLFSGSIQINALIEKQKKNFIDSLSDEPDAFQRRFVELGKRHYAHYKIPYGDFVKGTDILKVAFIGVAIDELNQAQLVKDILAYFKLSLEFMSKGYLISMIQADKKYVSNLINRFETIQDDGQQLSLDQLKWLFNILLALEQTDINYDSTLKREQDIIYQKLRRLISQPDSPAYDVFATAHLDDLHERLFNDAESLFYFLRRGEYTDILPIYTGLLSVYKISLFLISGYFVSARLSETRDQLREQEERYRQLFEQSNDAIFIFNSKTGKFMQIRLQKIFSAMRQKNLPRTPDCYRRSFIPTI